MKLLTNQQHECIAFAQQPKAGGIIWKDGTLYSETDLRIPRIFEAYFADARVTISCCYPQHMGKWVMTCIMIGFAPTVLTATTVTEAAEQAVEICRVRAYSIAAAFREPVAQQKGWFECVCNFLMNNKGKHCLRY